MKQYYVVVWYDKTGDELVETDAKTSNSINEIDACWLHRYIYIKRKKEHICGILSPLFL